MNRKLVFVPLLLILALCFLLFRGLQQDPKQIASALIGKPIPEFYQADLLNPTNTLSNTDLPKEPFLLNVWGSWCVYCKIEHPFLMRLTEQGIKIVGLNYRDKAQSAVEMLRKMGNPFVSVIDDSQGILALKLGVDGAPETYLIDGNGVIRYRHSGELNQEIWRQKFLPEWEKWQ
ncbi:DsbE family thiol:disulfide interchange protein [Caviibacterium pharyngocola]|uniref:Thiol:disulfide interchange protein n=1 Tax=Caviibacterium pharyngocola TaxID=28159 RepID=A0A2M8RV97_9PAST|nr:DsbE family thiol:disulfide interchange protein [Caviibacterium pharyngocola]PJG82822.1 thiol:disulfide interchange protein [Caviibacterium pharyngocola]